MGQTRGQINLREPGFLLWLGQFVGEWRLDGEVQIRRRKDGFLEASSLSTFDKVPLGSVLRHGELVERAQRSPGPYPVELSAALMSHWLAPEECSRLRNAGRVGAGMKLILEAIEKHIAELPQPERDQRWVEWWAAGLRHFLRCRMPTWPAIACCIVGTVVAPNNSRIRAARRPNNCMQPTGKKARAADAERSTARTQRSTAGISALFRNCPIPIPLIVTPAPAHLWSSAQIYCYPSSLPAASHPG